MAGDLASTISLFMVAIRGVVLIIAAIGGILSMYWGQKLYREGLASTVSAELSSSRSWTFKMRSLGPGVFFALFGMVLLIYLVTQPMEIQSTGEYEEPGETTDTVPAPAATSASFDPFPLLASQVRRPQQPTQRHRRGRCLVRGVTWRMSDGSILTTERINQDLREARRLLLKLERPRLDAADQAALNDSIDTIDAIHAAIAANRAR